MRWAAFAAALALAAVVGGADARSTATGPLLGANFTHFGNTPPNCYGLGIIHHYDRPGVRKLVRTQLAAMRAAGLRTLRTLFYHSSEGDEWSFMPSSGGRLAEPYRSNLIRYLIDVRAAGFPSLTIAFNPWYSNDPVGYDNNRYEPSKFEENWQLIRDVRPLVKKFGPATTHIDLINEGAPEWYTPQLREYSAEMWKRYVDEFGRDDATVSVIVKTDEGGSFDRLPNLVDAIRATGRPLPAWFDVHPSFTAFSALADLRGVDDYLTREGLTQPLVIGEEVYDNAEVAKAIATFMRTSSRPVLEVMEWPLSRKGTTFDTCPTAPYRIAAYARALTDIKPYTVDARISNGKLSLTSEGVHVMALAAGLYSVVIHDASSRDGFRLMSPSFDRRTTARFRGIVTWRIRLHQYEELRYGGLHKPLRRVAVLGDGGH